MSNKRMNHVFNEMVVKAGRDIDTAELQFINGGVSATFFCTQQAIHAAHAINNHDRMVKEIAELREALPVIKQMIFSMKTNAHTFSNENVEEVSREGRSAMRLIDKLLAKLNQEGEE